MPCLIRRTYLGCVSIQGEAQLLLEQYSAARDSFRGALLIDSSDNSAHAGLSAADLALAADTNQINLAQESACPAAAAGPSKRYAADVAQEYYA